MFRPASRIIILRQSLLRRSTSFDASPGISRRLISSTASPAQKGRGWKSSALRWGLAIAGVYYYSTSDVFAESAKISQRPPASSSSSSSGGGSGSSSSITEAEPEPLTIESLSPERRKSSRSPPAEQDGQTALAENRSILKEPMEGEEDASSEVQELEEEAEGQGAFNPETGEINWDCPCLGEACKIASESTPRYTARSWTKTIKETPRPVAVVEL
ncbi:hypothetical protein GP486_006904 [Trichoglossum hirsutum]|uniref:Uncharacterized protein n=1 Tax=Trichoglossum hirsutum TaxID=265104 RepID=A0A9P8L755_9PEZI|nr:hypothetical protein GP486_006904 [Trichoglossum hirsutum]